MTGFTIWRTRSLCTLSLKLIGIQAKIKPILLILLFNKEYVHIQENLYYQLFNKIWYLYISINLINNFGYKSLKYVYVSLVNHCGMAKI